jgi:prepilin-type N-terminal cleavage/methylation domain-containing protein
MTPMPRARRGFSLIELSVAMTIMGILISFAAPSFTRAVEQSKADVAGANLRAVWSAQRLYRLDNPLYAPDLPTLVTAGLLDGNFPFTSGSSTPPYAFAVGSPDGTGQTFTITATRSGGVWAGSFSIDQTGAITGTLTCGSEVPISPGFQ